MKYNETPEAVVKSLVLRATRIPMGMPFAGRTGRIESGETEGRESN